MKELRDKQKLKNTLYSTPLLVVLAILVFFLARGAGAIMLKERESAETLENLREKNEGLKERQEELKEEVSRLRTDEGIVEEIRSKFNVTRAGEHLAIVVEENHKASTTEASVLKRGWRWFLGLWGD